MTSSQTSLPASSDDLPRWDLSDLFDSRDSFDAALAKVAKETPDFATRYKGNLNTLSGEDLAHAISDFEELQDQIGRLLSFAFLTYVTDMGDPEIAAFKQNAQERINELTSDLIFFTLELNVIDDESLNEKLQDPKLDHYRPWIRDSRAFQPYQLSDELEQLLHQKDVSGSQAWNRLFDETMSGLTFQVGEEALNAEQALNRLSSANRDERKEAASALSNTFEDNIRLFAHITNVLAKDKQIEDEWRGFETPQSSRHLANRVETEVVDALVDAVRTAYPRLSHRYYQMKAGWLGQDKLSHFDRNAPLPATNDRFISWEEAKEIVLEAYGAFSPELANLGREFFDKPWIDADVRQGKAPGAFAHPTVPTAHPYLMVNYLGKPRDVMTVAHELGHGVHQVLAAKQGPLMADTPLTLAETASVFGEQLTFRRLLDREGDPQKRKMLIASKVEDMLNTVVRQIAFYTFEAKVHEGRRKGELPPEALNEIWMDIQRESLGPAFELTDDYRTYWCYIPHFIHSPFYVYAYAFGDCLVNSLYAVYQDAEEGFQDRYFDMLKAGGRLRHKELLAPFGLDASDPAFWQKGLSVIESFIDELAE